MHILRHRETHNYRIPNALKLIACIWCFGALIFLMNHNSPQNTSNSKKVRRTLSDLHKPTDLLLNNAKPQAKSIPASNEDIVIPSTCGQTRNTFVAAYGQVLDEPIWSSFWRSNGNGNDPSRAVKRAFGCSMHAMYCTGKPQAIPCCTKILFDMWTEFDVYLTKYNVTYSLRWGSLLFAVRNGMHMPWDGRDIDLGFLRPKQNAQLAVQEFARDWNVIVEGSHHILDIGAFFELHHQQYGYPNPEQKHCFVNFEFTQEIQEYKYTHTLEVPGNFFLDIGFDDEGANGMDTTLSHGMDMIPVNYDGSNGMKAPRQLYVYPDYYVHLNRYYGKWQWLDVIPPYIPEFQCQFHGLNKHKMEQYWNEMKRRTMQELKDVTPKQLRVIEVTQLSEEFVSGGDGDKNLDERSQQEEKQNEPDSIEDLPSPNSIRTAQKLQDLTSNPVDAAAMIPGTSRDSGTFHAAANSGSAMFLKSTPDIMREDTSIIRRAGTTFNTPSARNIRLSAPEEEYMRQQTLKKRLGLKYVGPQVASYEAKAVSMCLCLPGSLCSYVCTQKWLMGEIAIYCSLFGGTLMATVFNNYNFVPNAIVESSSLGALVSFLLGLYISLHIARWWRLRTDGLGNIWSASSGTATLLGATYKMYKWQHKDNKEARIEILERIQKIRRYCQLSLALVFTKWDQSGFDWEHLEDLEVVDSNQRRDIESKGGSYPEYVWHCVMEQVLMIKRKYPNFLDPETALSLNEQVLKGRSGAGLIGAQMNTQLPLTYVHGITFLCKVYNCTTCVLSAIQLVLLLGDDLKKADPGKYGDLSYAEMSREAPIIFTWNALVCFVFVMIKVIAISVLLLFCSELAWPFDNDVVAFPGANYLYWIAMDFTILMGFDIHDELTALKDKVKSQKNLLSDEDGKTK